MSHIFLLGQSFTHPILSIILFFKIIILILITHSIMWYSILVACVRKFVAFVYIQLL